MGYWYTIYSAGNGTVDVFAKYNRIGEQETDLLNAALARARETENLTTSIDTSKMVGQL